MQLIYSARIRSSFFEAHRPPLGSEPYGKYVTKHIFDELRNTFCFMVRFFGLHNKYTSASDSTRDERLANVNELTKEFGQKGCIQSGTQDLADAPSASHKATNPSGVGHTRADDNKGSKSRWLPRLPTTGDKEDRYQINVCKPSEDMSQRKRDPTLANVRGG